MKKIFALFLLIGISTLYASFPVAEQGRFRPSDVYIKHVLNEIYHHPSIKSKHRHEFSGHSDMEIVWNLHFDGFQPYPQSPLIFIKSAKLKNHLQLPTKHSHFSYQQLDSALSKSALSEIDEEIALRNTLHTFSSKHQDFRNASVYERLRNAGSDYLALPYKAKPGEWVSLRALKLDIPNFTPYPDSLFGEIKSAYLNRNTNDLSKLLEEAYSQIAGQPYRVAQEKVLTYPSLLQLKVESLLYRYPWVILCSILYGSAFLLGVLSFSRSTIFFAGLAFLLHTSILVARCYVLERPPVSNMFETLIYVPWVAMLGGFLLRLFSRERWLLISAALANSLMLILLEVTQLNNHLDNVQAVLDSQYWLIVHVLMVVGSYGMFLLAGVMGHIYLLKRAKLGKENDETKSLGKQIVQAMYLGTALLIPGTILGGVWAAESWGRFWDWDPKESWAFISSCIYLIWIHAYRFGHIKFKGIAVGAITGLMAISFTWYGVNYILGTGLHSYGFGTGGEIYYYVYLLLEVLFIFIFLREIRVSYPRESR